MPSITALCTCGRDKPYAKCCQPIINGTVEATDAETLMRSRFSAYAVKNYHYILRTYAQCQRSKLTVEELIDSALDTRWLSLKVLSHKRDGNTAQVEFKAFYQIEKSYYVMHELSNFEVEDGKWRYVSGVIQSTSGELKTERNSACICNSGKKFKKCCGK